MHKDKLELRGAGFSREEAVLPGDDGCNPKAGSARARHACKHLSVRLTVLICEAAMRAVHKSSRIGARASSFHQWSGLHVFTRRGLIAGCRAAAAAVSDSAKLIITHGGPLSSRVDPRSPVAIESEG